MPQAVRAGRGAICALGTVVLRDDVDGADRRKWSRQQIALPLVVAPLGKDRGPSIPVWTVDATPYGLMVKFPSSAGLDPGQRVRLRLQAHHAQGDGRDSDIGAARVIRVASSEKGELGLGLLDGPCVPLLGPELVGVSPPMLDIKSQLATSSGCDLNVLILGETGTGKNVLANIIHRHSRDGEAPFIRVNCPSIPSALFESELFGHEKGAFTDARSAAPGLLRLAGEGTVLLDEIAEIPPPLQAKLLQVIEDKSFIPLGGSQPVSIAARIVATTNRPIAHAIHSGAFRQDLYYRLSEMRFEIPPLRHRSQDIPLLAEYFRRLYSPHYGKADEPFQACHLDELLRHDWPGNIRELENCVRRSVMMGRFHPPAALSDDGQHAHLQAAERRGSDGAQGGSSEPEAIEPPVLQPGETLPQRVQRVAENAEVVAIKRALARCANNHTRAARSLGISYRTLARKLAKYRIGR